MSEDASEFDRGHVAGSIDARLAGHDKHFSAINGHLADLAHQMTMQSMSLQRLADQAEAAQTTMVATAAAVEKARKETADAVESERKVRKERSDQTWTPVTRILAILAGASVILNAVLAFSK